MSTVWIDCAVELRVSTWSMVISGGIAVADVQEVAELAHIGCGVEVAGDDHRGRAGSFGVVRELGFGGGDPLVPLREGVGAAGERGHQVDAGDHGIVSNAGDAYARGDEVVAVLRGRQSSERVSAPQTHAGGAGAGDQDRIRKGLAKAALAEASSGPGGQFRDGDDVGAGDGEVDERRRVDLALLDVGGQHPQFDARRAGAGCAPEIVPGHLDGHRRRQQDDADHGEQLLAA